MRKLALCLVVGMSLFAGTLLLSGCPSSQPAPAHGDGHMYECSTCGCTSSVPGNCPSCGKAFKRQG
ncbi:hypothetical protein HY251_10710 [bacterium]|nr:hypothetical protein [bacterium]